MGCGVSTPMVGKGPDQEGTPTENKVDKVLGGEPTVQKASHNVLIWTAAEFGTGIKFVDEQHQVLFRYLSLLTETLEEQDLKKQREAMVRHVQGLQEYAVYHFKAEEEMLEKYPAYPLLPQHRSIHVTFTNTIAGIAKKIEEVGTDAANAENVLVTATAGAVATLKRAEEKGRAKAKAAEMAGTKEAWANGGPQNPPADAASRSQDDASRAQGEGASRAGSPCHSRAASLDTIGVGGDDSTASRRGLRMTSSMESDRWKQQKAILALVKFLRGWIMQHIHEEDRKYMEYVPPDYELPLGQKMASEAHVKQVMASGAGVRLIDILRTDKGLELFSSYADAEFSIENVQFWVQARKFATDFGEVMPTENDPEASEVAAAVKAADPERQSKMIAECSRIVNEFVISSAPLCINVPSAQKKKVELAVANQQITANTLAECQETIYKLMETDSFPRFQRSRLFEEFITYYTAAQLAKQLSREVSVG